MSSTTISSYTFRSIFDAALDSYAKQTGIDLTKHPSADELQSCGTSDDVLKIFQDKETDFKEYRDRHRRLINSLRPVVQVVHALSGVLGEVSGLVSKPPGSAAHYLMLFSSLCHQVPFQPTKAIFVSVDVLLSVCFMSACFV
jgi:hypothetical protein